MLLANGLEARYFMSVDAILSVENGAHVRAGDVLVGQERPIAENQSEAKTERASLRSVKLPGDQFQISDHLRFQISDFRSGGSNLRSLRS